MYLLGHTDAKLTLSVYQQVLDMGAGSIEVLEGVLGCRVLVASSYPRADEATTRPPEASP
jgi:hypothetical protein